MQKWKFHQFLNLKSEDTVSTRACLDYKCNGNADVLSKLSIMQWNKLKLINIAGNYIDDDFLKEFIPNYIDKEGSELETLDLSFNQFTEVGINLLLQACQHSTFSKLRTIFVQGNQNLKAETHILVQTLYPARIINPSFPAHSLNTW